MAAIFARRAPIRRAQSAVSGEEGESAAAMEEEAAAATRTVLVVDADTGRRRADERRDPSGKRDGLPQRSKPVCCAGAIGGARTESPRQVRIAATTAGCVIAEMTSGIGRKSCVSGTSDNETFGQLPTG